MMMRQTDFHSIYVDMMTEMSCSSIEMEEVDVYIQNVL